LANGVNGVLITGVAASGNLIGGPNAGERNLISGNDASGVAIITFATNNTIQGNRIGTDASGTVRQSNKLAGIFFQGAVTHNLIGGAAPGEGNLISGNTIGIGVTGARTRDNRVLGNIIGTTADGRGELGNTTVGVLFTDGASEAQVGGAARG